MKPNDNINDSFKGAAGDDEDIKLDYVSGSRRKTDAKKPASVPSQNRSNNAGGTRVFSTVNKESSAPVKKSAPQKSSKKSSSFSAMLASFIEGTGKKFSEFFAGITSKKEYKPKPAPKPSYTASSQAPKKSGKKHKKSNGLLGGFVRFTIYIVCVAAVSVLLSYTIIRVANDMFAFSKSDTVITVSIPEEASSGEISKILSKNEIITNPTVFKFYTDYKKGKSKYYTEGFKSGEFELSPSMDYDELILALSNNIGTREVVRLTFPEGSTIDEIINILIAGGVQNTKEQYVDVIQNFDFDYRFINELDTENFKEGRKYRLEGYLFPDTYDFYTDASAVDVINKFLVNFNNKFDATFYDAAKDHGLTVDEIITIASLVEKEARKRDDFTGVSSVFHNRLKYRANYPHLQSDATIQYAFPERKSKITPEDLKYDSPYNTYIYSGLPPSAIANPGLDAITAALYPDDTSYYYFISNNVGVTYFAKTLPEHNANVAKVRKESES